MAAGRNYVRRGDAFSDLVRRGEGPPAVIHWQHQGTGRDYYTRIPVHHCQAFRASDAGAALKQLAQQLPSLVNVPTAELVSLLALDWQPLENRSTIRLIHHPKELKAEVRLRLTVTLTGHPAARGTRVWLVCPRCTRRCGAVYASRWDEQGLSLPGRVVLGCRTCLGLTDESRQRHKTPDWASAVLGQRPYKHDKSGYYRRRGVNSLDRAHWLFMASMGRFFDSMDRTFPEYPGKG